MSMISASRRSLPQRRPSAFSRIRLLFVPVIGGLLLGLGGAGGTGAAASTRFVDPIEANALHGGRMSLRGFRIWLTLTTVISNAAGASVGMEAGYSQLGAGLYSWVGRWFRLAPRRSAHFRYRRRGAAAIAAAFNATAGRGFLWL